MTTTWTSPLEDFIDNKYKDISKLSIDDFPKAVYHMAKQRQYDLVDELIKCDKSTAHYAALGYAKIGDLKAIKYFEHCKDTEEWSYKALCSRDETLIKYAKTTAYAYWKYGVKSKDISLLFTAAIHHPHKCPAEIVCKAAKSGDLQAYLQCSAHCKNKPLKLAFYAAIGGNHQIIDLVKKEDVPKEEFFYGYAASGNISKIFALIKYAPKLMCEQAIEYAIIYKQIEVVLLLLNQIDVGDDILITAVETGSKNIIDAIINNGKITNCGFSKAIEAMEKRNYFGAEYLKNIYYSQKTNSNNLKVEPSSAIAKFVAKVPQKLRAVNYAKL